MRRSKLDKIDRRILRDLQADGRITNVELASRAGISAPPCLRRVRALEEAGFIRGYHATVPLTASEVDLLPELILARMVARIVITEWRAARFPENRAYIMRSTPRAWEHLNRLLAIPADERVARIRSACRPGAADS